MKRIIFILLLAVFIMSMLFMGTACKEEATAEVVVEEETEEAAEEVSEEAEEETTVEVEEETEEIGMEKYLPEDLEGSFSFLHFADPDPWLPVLDAFKSVYPNIEIELQSKPTEANATTFVNNLNSNKPADVLQYWCQQPVIDAYDLGKVAVLDDMLNTTGFNDIATGTGLTMSKCFNEDLPQIIVPIRTAMWGIWYNLDLWAQAGLTEDDIPETWDEFLDVCQTIQDAGILPIVRNGDGIGWGTMVWVDYFLLRTDVDYRNALMKAEEVFDNDLYRAADKHWDEVIPYMSPNADTLGYNDAWMGFANGDGAMYFCGSWVLGLFEEDMGFIGGEDYGVFPFPVIDPGVDLYEPVVQEKGVVLSIEGEKNPAAVAFIAWMSTEEGQKAYNDLSGEGAIPVIDTIESNYKMNNELINAFEGRNFIPMWAFVTELRGDMWDIFNARGLGLIDQVTSIEQLDTVYEDYHELEEQ